MQRRNRLPPAPRSGLNVDDIAIGAAVGLIAFLSQKYVFAAVAIIASALGLL